MGRSGKLSRQLTAFFTRAPTVTTNQPPRRLIAAVACGALDTNSNEPAFTHPITIQP